jgi:hypothetical protein
MIVLVKDENYKFWLNLVYMKENSSNIKMAGIILESLFYSGLEVRRGCVCTRKKPGIPFSLSKTIYIYYWFM